MICFPDLGNVKLNIADEYFYKTHTDNRMLGHLKTAGYLWHILRVSLFLLSDITDESQLHILRFPKKAIKAYLHISFSLHLIRSRLGLLFSHHFSQQTSVTLAAPGTDLGPASKVFDNTGCTVTINILHMHIDALCWKSVASLISRAAPSTSSPAFIL